MARTEIDIARDKLANVMGLYEEMSLEVQRNAATMKRIGQMRREDDQRIAELEEAKLASDKTANEASSKLEETETKNKELSK